MANSTTKITAAVPQPDGSLLVTVETVTTDTVTLAAKYWSKDNKGKRKRKGKADVLAAVAKALKGGK